MKLKNQSLLPFIKFKHVAKKFFRPSSLFNFTQLLFPIVSLLSSSCNSHTPNKNIFHYNETAGIATLDPAFAKNQSVMWAVHQLYNTLVQIDEHTNIIPSLAKSWDISADNLEFTFHLRTDVFFHENKILFGNKKRQLTARDVVYSFKRIIDKNTASSGAWIFNDRVDPVNGFAAINDSTFQLKLTSPFNPILGILSMQYCSILPYEAIEKYGNNFRRNPCGTGPFKMVAWEEGQALILNKNENYFEKDSTGNHLPYLDGIKVSFHDNKATEFLEFQQKRLDFINDIDASFKDELLTKKGELRKEWEGKIVLSKHPYLNIEFLGILFDTTNLLVKNSPLKFRQIRQAINYSINREKMMLYVRNSIGTAAEVGFIPAGLPSFDSTSHIGYKYNQAKALELLKEAGYPNGNGLPVIKLLTVPQYADFGSYIANELQQTGIKVQVEAVQKSLLLEETSKSQALFFRGSWIADYPDAENYLSVFYSHNPAPPNYTQYKNSAFDLLYEKALAEKNDSARTKLYRQADSIMMKDAPVVPLWYDMVIHFVQPYVSSFTPNSLNLLELRKVKLNR